MGIQGDTTAARKARGGPGEPRPRPNETKAMARRRGRKTGKTKVAARKAIEAQEMVDQERRANGVPLRAAARAAAHAATVRETQRALTEAREALKDWVAAHPADAQAHAEEYHRLRITVARHDPNEFIEFVARDEETGSPVLQEPIHEEFQRLATVHPRLVLWAHIESGKTTQLALMRVLWELGRNPNLRVVIVSATASKAGKIATAIQQYIERSAELREVFPHLQPGKRWASTSFTVQRDSYSRDYSVQAIGVHTDIIGARIDLVVLDDIMTFETAATPASRAKLQQWMKASIMGRLTRRSRVWMDGTAWHPDDALHMQAKVEGWASARFPVRNDETGALTWPERWSEERIATATIDLGPLEAARQLHCRARDDGEARFQREWINRCLQRGEGKEPTQRLAGLPPGYRTYTGVDLGARQHGKADLSVLFTIVVHPDETREVLWVDAGRWTAPEVLERIYDHHARYFSIVLVENNAAQDFLLQFARRMSAVPILPFNTGRNKVNPEFGVESLAVEMYAAKWIIPNLGGSCAPEVAAWISEMLFYQPGAHTGDRLMASWFAREGARGKPPRKKARVGTVALQRR
jgi:hypothetical protein